MLFIFITDNLISVVVSYHIDLMEFFSISPYNVQSRGRATAKNGFQIHNEHRKKNTKNKNGSYFLFSFKA